MPPTSQMSMTITMWRQDLMGLWATLSEKSTPPTAHSQRPMLRSLVPLRYAPNTHITIDHHMISALFLSHKHCCSRMSNIMSHVAWLLESLISSWQPIIAWQALKAVTLQSVAGSYINVHASYCLKLSLLSTCSNPDGNSSSKHCWELRVQYFLLWCSR